MEKEHGILLLLLTIISSTFLLKPISVAGAKTDDCLSASCGPNEPEVRFPFRILGQQPAHCGFPGLDLSCDQQNRTIIRLPSNHSYIVTAISYYSQIIYIDPEFCLPHRIVDVDINNTPFNSGPFWSQTYTFYNCSKIYTTSHGYRFPCLSKGNYSVIASTRSMPSNHCKVMKSIVVPVVRFYTDITYQLGLTWTTPNCISCEFQNYACRLASDDGQTVCVTPSSSISRSAKYGIGIGIGAPVLTIFIVGLICYASSRSTYNQSIDISSITIIRQSATRTGLDGPTIESYPKTVLGESCRLPNDDATCAICLSNYKPKESLRTIPECNHYFHSECIDEWLKLNATCPVCRNTPESSTLVTPCSSASSTLSSVESR